VLIDEGSLIVQGRKERLVTTNRFSCTSPECRQHQSDWRKFNNYIHLWYRSYDWYLFKQEQEL